MLGFTSAIDAYIIYGWPIPLKNTLHSPNVDKFEKILEEREGNPNKIRLDKASEFHKRVTSEFLEENENGVYSTEHKVKSEISRRFIRTFNNKIYQYMTLILMYFEFNNSSDIVVDYVLHILCKELHF